LGAEHHCCLRSHEFRFLVDWVRAAWDRMPDEAFQAG
jgi:hypothetical protein